MEGASLSFETFAIRMKSDMLEWPEGKTVEKYCVEPGTFCGFVMVFSTRNGEPLAIINDGIIQHMRVGGCAGLGVKYLAREDARVIGLLGSGGMARTYLLAFNEVRKISEVRVYSPNRKNRESYAAEMSAQLGLNILPVERAEEAVRGSDIVATCTDSIQVVVSDPTWIEPGMHLTCVKSNEWDPAIVKRCDLIFKMGRATMVLDVGMRRIGGEAALVAGCEDEIKRIANPAVDIFSADYPLLTDVKRANNRMEEERVTPLILYRLRLFGIPFGWKTMITVWDPPHQFVDQQISGPYKLWVQTHRFEEDKASTVIADTVEYQLPLWPVGEIAYPFVYFQLKRIFSYRQQMVRKILLALHKG